MPAGRRSLRQVVVEALAEARRSNLTEHQIADLVLDQLVSVELLNGFGERTHNLFCAAAAAYDLRDDLYDNPHTSSNIAEIAVAALTDAVLEQGLRFAGSDREAAAVVSGLRYKDWRFELVKLAEGQLAVRVRARVPDTRGGSEFVIGRTAAVITTVEDAAFRAVMQIEDHEARERFYAGSDKPFDPHDPKLFAPSEATLRRP